MSTISMPQIATLLDVRISETTQSAFAALSPTERDGGGGW